jgi:hypothetical protein
MLLKLSVRAAENLFDEQLLAGYCVLRFAVRV